MEDFDPALVEPKRVRSECEKRTSNEIVRRTTCGAAATQRDTPDFGLHAGFGV